MALIPALITALLTTALPAEAGRVELTRTPEPAGSVQVWMRCDWTERTSAGAERSRQCGGAGQVAWTWDAGAVTWRLEGMVGEPDCPAAHGLAGATWAGRLDEQGFARVERVDSPEPDDVAEGELAARDLLAELGDALQRLVVPLPEGRLRSGSTFAMHAREVGGGVVAELLDYWTARKKGRTIRLQWEGTTALQVPGGPVTTERWTGELTHDPQGVFALGTWESTRPVRRVEGERWVESVAHCKGELRPWR